MPDKKKILLIAGTRPEAIKLAPLYLALKKNNHFETLLISTGQHREMLIQIFLFFGIKPDIELDIMQPNQTLAGLTSLLFTKLDQIFTEHLPDLVVVQGDTTTAMVGAMVAYYRKISIAHVEAGLRSGNKFSPFPEEVNRNIVSIVADFHFAPTAQAASNIEKGFEGKVYVVGNSVIDSLLLGLEKVKLNETPYRDRFAKDIPKNKKLILVTAHRRESFGGGLDNICKAILQLSEKHPDLHFLFPVHLNPNVRTSVNSLLQNKTAIKLIDPIGYDDMIYLMSQAFLILTDSGGLQEEAPSLNVPLLVLREVTERMEGVEAGCSQLVGTDINKIVEGVDTLLSNPKVYQAMQSVPNPYGDGKTSETISSILTRDFANS